MVDLEIRKLYLSVFTRNISPQFWCCLNYLFYHWFDTWKWKINKHIYIKLTSVFLVSSMTKFLLVQFPPVRWLIHSFFLKIFKYNCMPVILLCVLSIFDRLSWIISHRRAPEYKKTLERIWLHTYILYVDVYHFIASKYVDNSNRQCNSFVVVLCMRTRASEQLGSIWGSGG